MAPGVARREARWGRAPGVRSAKPGASRASGARLTAPSGCCAATSGCSGRAGTGLPPREPRCSTPPARGGARPCVSGRKQAEPQNQARRTGAPAARRVAVARRDAAAPRTTLPPVFSAAVSAGLSSSRKSRRSQTSDTGRCDAPRAAGRDGPASAGASGGGPAGRSASQPASPPALRSMASSPLPPQQRSPGERPCAAAAAAQRWC